MLGIAAKLLERLRTEVAENRMLAKHRQFVARKHPSFAGLVLRHANKVSKSRAGVKRPVPIMIMTIIMIMV